MANEIAKMSTAAQVYVAVLLVLMHIETYAIVFMAIAICHRKR